MIPMLLAVNGYQGACTFAAIDQGTWVQINMIVVLLALVLGAAVYAFSSMLPIITREKLKGAVRVEIFQAVLSIFIVIILLGFAATACQAGASLTSGLTATTGAYTDPMQFSQQYLSNLLFIRAGQLFGQIYAQSAIFLIDGHIAQQIAETIDLPLIGLANLQLNPNITGVYFGYTGVLTGTYTALIVAAYAVLFLFYLMIPIVEAFALTVLLPITLILRAWPFGGPRLREAANSFMAIAIAFYFILPLTITFNNYVVNWMYCSNDYVGSGQPLQSTATNCNPYASYVSSVAPLATLPTDSLFTATNTISFGFGSGPGTSNLAASWHFYGGVLSGGGGLLSILSGTLTNLFKVPLIIVSYGYQIAEFMFESIVLLALDIAITIGFAQGLSKGLNAVSGALGVGPFWGNM